MDVDCAVLMEWLMLHCESGCCVCVFVDQNKSQGMDTGLGG